MTFNLYQVGLLLKTLHPDAQECAQLIVFKKYLYLR